jgi:hypothetical protein
MAKRGVRRSSLPRPVDVLGHFDEPHSSAAARATREGRCRRLSGRRRAQARREWPGELERVARVERRRGKGCLGGRHGCGRRSSGTGECVRGVSHWAAFALVPIDESVIRRCNSCMQRRPARRPLRAFGKQAPLLGVERRSFARQPARHRETESQRPARQRVNQCAAGPRRELESSNPSPRYPSRAFRDVARDRIGAREASRVAKGLRPPLART